MYSDGQSIRDFKHRHARDRLIEEAQHLDGAADGDVVDAHLRLGDREGVLVIAIVVGLLGASAAAALLM